MEFDDCRNSYSFFKKIDSVWGGLTSKRPLNRIFTIMRLMQSETIITEEFGKNCPEWGRFKQEEKALSLRLGSRLKKIDALKLTFVRKNTPNKDVLSSLIKAASKGEEDVFLGYAIVVNVTVEKGVWSYIFESVVREIGMWNSAGQWQPLPNHYLHVKKKFPGEVGNETYEISGVYFRQQNSITSVCAHACVGMMLNNASLPLGIVTAEDINQHLDFDHVKKKFMVNESCIGEKEKYPAGPGIPQLINVFKHYGYEPHLLEFDNVKKQQKFRSFLYGFVESQFPALLTFGSHVGSPDKEVGHVVPVVGHTLNPHSWLPATGSYAVGNWSDKHHSPLGWIDDLIIHDDNFGMQFSLPAHAFKPALNPDKEDNLTPREAMGIFPKSYNLQLLGNAAESIAASIIRTMAEKSRGVFFSGNFYSERFWSEREQTLRKSTIFRPVLVKWDNYLKSIWQERQMPADTSRFIESVRKQNITHVWLVEVTEPDLFIGNKAKVFDVVLNPHFKPTILANGDISDDEAISLGAVLMVRTPQRAITPEPGSTKWIEISGWKVEGHIPLFCHGCV
jgi:hypothetical protein